MSRSWLAPSVTAAAIHGRKKYINMELNARQMQCLRTCLPSCQNVAYPALGLVEELGEFIEKLLPLVEWSPDFADRPYLDFLLRGIAHNAHCIGILAKQVCHESLPVPFQLKSSLGNGDPRLYDERIEQLRQELGDISWMLNVTDFYVVNTPALAQPSFDHDHDTLDGTHIRRHVKLVPTADSLARLNAAKLASRQSASTIDAKGDTTRTPIE